MTTRRRFIAAAAAASAAAGIGAGFWWRNRPRDPEIARASDVPMPPDPAFPNRLAVPGLDGLNGILDVPGTIAIAAKSLSLERKPGRATPRLVYECEHQGRTFYNPTLRARQGASVRVQFWNALAEPSIIHWHGFRVDSNNDGHPHYAVPGGARYDYLYTIANRAATCWYHPHPHHLAGKQTHLGLAGLFVIEDEDETRLQQALDLKLGESDIPLVIQDARLENDGRIGFEPTAEERAHGYLGGEIIVNHTPRPYFEAASRIHRFRMVNASNARVYRLAFLNEEGTPLAFHLIGNDGGLLERPHSVHEAFLAPAERLDVLLDLGNAHPGDAILLASLAFDAMHAERGNHRGHGRGAHHAHHHAGATLEEGAPFEVMKIHVRSRIEQRGTMPARLSSIAPIDVRGARRRTLHLDRVKESWRINGLAYDVRATPIVVRRGSVEIWELRNAARGMPHPVHVHGFQFQVLRRIGSPEQQRRNAVDDAGRCATDLGWKDTVLVWPGETAEVAIDFSHGFLGDQVYMVHCHNFEHEDHGMMLNFKVAG